MRGRVVPGWILGLLGGALAIEIAHFGTLASALAKQSLALAAVAVVAGTVWRMTDDQWAEPPVVLAKRMHSADRADLG